MIAISEIKGVSPYADPHARRPRRVTGITNDKAREPLMSAHRMQQVGAAGGIVAESLAVAGATPHDLLEAVKARAGWL